MKYLSFIGNHDKIERGSNEYGAVLSIFQKYSQKIEQVYLFVTPDKKSELISYHSIALENMSVMEAINPAVNVCIVSVSLPNPIDYDLVYPFLLDKVQELNTSPGFLQAEKIINITSGTPTMTACWILLSQAGIITNARLIQSFESRFAIDKRSNIKEVNLNIDDFPHIEAPSAIKRQLTLVTRENKALVQKLASHELDLLVPELIGQSDNVREIKEQILYDINNNTSVLILGERGTGKQVVANSIWRLYRNESDVNLLTLDCGTLPRELIAAELFGYKKGAFTGADKESPGIIKQAENRFLFLDEIGNMPKEGQNTLLRFLNDGEVRSLGSAEITKVGTRIIAATNKNVNDSTLFAPDLKDRFDEVVLLPPLREHRQDIPLLIDYFIQLYYKQFFLSSPIILDKSVTEKLMDYDWPGNIRELEKWIKRVFRRFSTGIIHLHDLPERFITDILKEEDTETTLPELPLSVALDEYIEMIRLKARGLSNGNMAEVDRLLKQSPGTEKQRAFREKKKKG